MHFLPAGLTFCRSVSGVKALNVQRIGFADCHMMIALGRLRRWVVYLSHCCLLLSLSAVTVLTCIVV